jgi:hypothetical protein
MSGRVAMALTAAAIAIVLALSLWLSPDPRGHGTHERLGLPPCSTMRLLGFPCPTCGMTTAFSLAARGRFAEAFQTQPAGAAGFGLACLAVPVLTAVAASGRCPRAGRRVWIATALLIGAGVLAAWVHTLWRFGRGITIP